MRLPVLGSRLVSLRFQTHFPVYFSFRRILCTVAGDHPPFVLNRPWTPSWLRFWDCGHRLQLGDVHYQAVSTALIQHRVRLVTGRGTLHGRHLAFVRQEDAPVFPDWIYEV